jgi:ABC-type antimicrobial peptide transport system, permease component
MLALVLACVGLYRVTVYAVAKRTDEIGIRMAMGAERTNILNLIMRSALGQVKWGMAIGISVALAGGRVLASAVRREELRSMIVGLAAAVLVACALLAAAVPARRASGLDPLVALRYE